MRGARHELWVIGVLAATLLACASAPEPDREVSGGWSEPTSGDESVPEPASGSGMVTTGAMVAMASAPAISEQEEAPAEPAPMRSATARAPGGYDFVDERAGAGGVPPAAPPRLYAQAQPVSKGKEEQAPGDAATNPEVASDGRSGQLLIYEANLGMAVYQVEEIQRQAIAIATELGGFLAEQSDKQVLVVRVPAAQFETALKRIEALGQVFQRYVKAQDVTDQYRDISLRLRNAEAMRDRLIELLAKANDVKSSLEVEHELDRLLERIELLKGQLKSLGDRIAFSTITVQFRPKREETLNPEFRLPFIWLQQLGLQHLLRFDE